MDDSSFCFINAHLAAGQSQTSQRNIDAAVIVKTASFKSIETQQVDYFASGGDGSRVFDHHYCFIAGDLNYRIDYPRNSVMDCISQRNWKKLSNHDQLNRQRAESRSFVLGIFKENPIDFAPTYKYAVNRDFYEEAPKFRIPAYCDRILWKGENIVQHSYGRYEPDISDHRPIAATFEIPVWKRDMTKYFMVRNELGF